MKDTALGHWSEAEIEAILHEERKKEADRSTRTLSCIGDCLNCIDQSLRDIDEAGKE